MPRITASLGALTVSALLCGTALASSPDPAISTVSMNQSLEASLRDAQTKRAAHDYTGAIRILSQLMLVAADDARVVGEYGKVLVQQGRPKEALDFLKRAVQLQDREWSYYSALGVAYDQTGDYNSARGAYERALALKPGETVVLNNYAMSRALAGDLPAAKRLIAQAAASGSDERIARNVQLIDGLTPKVAQAQPVPAAAQNGRPVPTPGAVQSRPLAPPPASRTATGSPHPLTTPRTITAAEGNRIMMQAVPSDPLAGPVAGKKAAAVAANTVPAKKAAPAPAKKAAADSNGIPALRLANDRQ